METVEKSNPDFSTVSAALGNPAPDTGFPYLPSQDGGGYRLPLKIKPAKIAGSVRLLRRAEFVDSEQRRHTIIDKVLIFSVTLLDDRSTYPQPGGVPCEAMARWRDARGRDLVRVSIGGGFESTEGLSEFVVLPTQLLAP